MARHPSLHPAGVKVPEIERRGRRSSLLGLGPYLPAMIILSLAVPLLIYLLFMQSMGWNLPLLGMHGAVSVAKPAGSNVILYNSSNSKSYFAGIGGNYDVLLGPWRSYFLSRKLEFREVQTPAQLHQQDSGVLVLPSAVALSDEERFEIMAFRSKGGAILGTWATGTRDGKGVWQGWQFLGNLGVRVIGELPASAKPTP